MKSGVTFSPDLSLADRIRAYVFNNYIQQAKADGQETVTVRAGDVHRDMGLSSSMPSVCSAIGGHRFTKTANVVLVDRKGPTNGANVYFTYSLNEGIGESTADVIQISANRRERVSRTYQQGTPVDLDHALVFVGCVKSKRPYPAPARELYISSWFHKARDLVEAHNAHWFVLSALYGLVRPDEVISPYDHTLKRLGVADRRAWSEMVLRQIGPLLGQTPRVVFFAGQRYREFLVEPLLERGLDVEIPMEGLTRGEQLAWLSETR